MKFVRFETKDKSVKYGILTNNVVKEVEGSIFDNPKTGNVEYPLDSIRLLAPVEPSKVLCIGLNYHDHAKEFGLAVPPQPLLFMKPPTSVIGTQENIIYPPQTQNLHYEVELAVVMGKEAKNIPRDKALSYVFGYTVGNDITARDIQNKESQWTRAKGFDTFCPLGPWIETEIDDPDNLDLRLVLNGEQKQKSNTANFVFKTAELIEYLSSIMTLLPGDVIMTGTPGGIGAMKVGDRVEATVQGIGTLTNIISK